MAGGRGRTDGPSGCKQAAHLLKRPITRFLGRLPKPDVCADCVKGPDSLPARG
ncbi:hypothetical protein GCM10023063_37790 [Arthrobacter methylotrophus]